MTTFSNHRTTDIQTSIKSLPAYLVAQSCPVPLSIPEEDLSFRVGDDGCVEFRSHRDPSIGFAAATGLGRAALRRLVASNLVIAAVAAASRGITASLIGGSLASSREFGLFLDLLAQALLRRETRRREGLSGMLLLAATLPFGSLELGFLHWLRGDLNVAFVLVHVQRHVHALARFSLALRLQDLK